MAKLVDAVESALLAAKPDLDKKGMDVKSVTLSLEADETLQGATNMAYVVTASGSITRTSASTLTFTLAPPAGPPEPSGKILLNGRLETGGSINLGGTVTPTGGGGAEKQMSMDENHPRRPETLLQHLVMRKQKDDASSQMEKSESRESPMPTPGQGDLRIGNLPEAIAIAADTAIQAKGGKYRLDLGETDVEFDFTVVGSASVGWDIKVFQGSVSATSTAVQKAIFAFVPGGE